MATLFQCKRLKKHRRGGKVLLAPAALAALRRLPENRSEKLLELHHKFVMSTVYPLTRRHLGDDWAKLLNSYLKRIAPAKFLQAAGGLSKYYTGHGGDLLSSYPHLAELADFEWTSFEVRRRQAELKAERYSSPRTTVELNELGPAANPAMVLRSYDFPIPAIANRLRKKIGLPEKVRPEATHLVIFKHPDTGGLEMLELSGVVARIVSSVLDKPVSYTGLIEMTAPLCRQPDTVEAIVSILELIDKLQNVHVFIGSKAITSPVKLPK